MARTTSQFMAIPPEMSSSASARYAILPIPYEGTVSYKDGTAAGPGAILDASAQVEWFDEELLGEYVQAGIMTCPVVQPGTTPQEQMRRVRQAADSVFRQGKFLLALGGEHSITAPLVAAAIKAHGPLSVLQIDAHADLRDSYSGTPHSHASVMRRVLEMTDRIAQVGIRNFSLEEYEQCPRQVANFMTPARIRSEPDWIDKVLDLLGPKVYLTVDIDGFDPAYAPGTGTPEPGGLSWHQVTGLLRRLCLKRQVVGADIVEVRPIGQNHVTEFLAARLAYKIVAYTQQCTPTGKKSNK